MPQAESLLVDVRAVDTTIRVEARYATPDNFTGAPLPGYERQRVLLRREVAEHWAGCSGGSAAGDWASGCSTATGRCGRRSRWSPGPSGPAGGQLLDSGYIARRSRHNQGVAVDLTLVDPETGAELPMGTPFDNFAPEAHTANAEGEVARHRETLVRAMESEGFTNYEKEWWHFSYQVDGAVPFDQVIR